MCTVVRRCDAVGALSLCHVLDSGAWCCCTDRWWLSTCYMVHTAADAWACCSWGYTTESVRRQATQCIHPASPGFMPLRSSVE
eukprot:16783-Eustigmatos_ZCMA.PRE.1